MKKHYYLYIDDSGSRFPDRQEPSLDNGMDYFALGGILIEEQNKILLEDKYKSFCERWDITYPLHSTKIRGMRNDFAWLEDGTKRKESFMKELEELLVSVPVIGFAAVIDRPGYNHRYKERYSSERWHLCKTSYSILIERVTKYVINQGGTFEIRFEEAGKKENKAIIKYAKELKESGSPFNKETSSKYNEVSADDYKKIILGEPRRRKKGNLFIQIADLYLYPMVKRKYDPLYQPWIVLFNSKTVIDSHLAEENYYSHGIKYSCFDVT